METITWKSLLKASSPYAKTILFGQFIAVLAVLASLPVPLLFPMLIDEVLLDKPGWVTGLIDHVYDVTAPVTYILIVLFATLWLRALFFFLNALQIKLFTTVSKSLVFALRERILQHLKKVSVSEYEALGGGGVSAKLVTDVNTVDTFIGVSVGRFFVSVLSLVGVAVVLFLINWQLAIILLTLNPAVVTFTFLLGRRIRKLKKEENLRIEEFQNALGETLDLFVQIRTHNQESRYIGRMVEYAEAIRNASVNFGWKSEAAGQLASLVFLCGFELLRAAAMVMVLLSDLTIGEMFAVMGYLWFMIAPLQEFLNIVFSYQNASAALERLNALLMLQREPEYPHLQNPFSATHANEVTLENVDFSYGQKNVLHEINVQIPRGKVVALLGPSGSGKTTLAQVILGLYAPSGGHIRVDGVDVHEIGLDTMREHIALVLQTPRMFNDTLRHNLTLGREIPDSKLYEALSIAQFDRVLSRLEQGLDTRIGKDGVRLSGGERQRLAIARMLVSDPNVVIMDESTSALDVQTEKHLFGSLSHYLEGKTILIIAHRLSTIEHADLIYVLKDGRIVESGTPEALLGHTGHYNDFVTGQTPTH